MSYLKRLIDNPTFNKNELDKTEFGAARYTNDLKYLIKPLMIYTNGFPQLDIEYTVYNLLLGKKLLEEKIVGKIKQLPESNDHLQLLLTYAGNDDGL